MSRMEAIITNNYILENLHESGGTLSDYNPLQDPTGRKLREVATEVRHLLKRARRVMSLKSNSFPSTPTTEQEDKVLWGMLQFQEQQLAYLEARNPSVGTAVSTKPLFGRFIPQTSLKQL